MIENPQKIMQIQLIQMYYGVNRMHQSEISALIKLERDENVYNHTLTAYRTFFYLFDHYFVDPVMRSFQPLDKCLRGFISEFKDEMYNADNHELERQQLKYIYDNYIVLHLQEYLKEIR